MRQLCKHCGDDELMQLVQHGNASAQTELVRRFSPRMLRLAVRITHSRTDGEDAVQNAWLSIFSKAKTFQFRSKVGTWIYSITLNAARLQYLRSTKYYTQRMVDIDCLFPEHPALVDKGPCPLQASIQNEQTSLRWRAMQSLHGIKRTTVMAYVAAGFRTDLAAGQLRIPVNTFKSRMHSARQLCRKKLAQFEQK